jgi:cytochrome c-type biogenesis protein
MTLEEFLARFTTSFANGSVWIVALLAGVTSSSLCPCTLPVGLGMAGAVGAAESRAPRTGLLIALAFAAGIVLNLTMLGALAGRIGAILTESFGRLWALAMALMSVAAAGVAFLGPRLTTDKLARLRRPGVAGSFAYGFVFSLGTSAAPLLLLLTVAAAQARPANGLLLALAFGVGRALPFLLVGVFAGAVMRFAALASWRRTIEVASGVALLFVGIYYARVFTALL